MFLLENIAYFNNAATTFPKPEIMHTFMSEYYKSYVGSVGRGGSTNIVNETRLLIKELCHCPNKKVVFTSTATEALNIIIQGITIADNSNVYISPFEHNSVTRVLNFLNNNNRFNIHELVFDVNKLKYDIKKIESQFIENKPNVIIVSHASNVCGTIAPIEEIFSLSKKYSSINIADLCQTAGLIDIDLSASIYDFAVFAGHKTLYGPLGISGFLCNDDIKLKPLIYGGAGIDSANETVSEHLPERFEVGSQNILSIAGLSASLKWILEIGIEKIKEVESKNKEKLIEILSSYNNINIISNYENSIGVVSCKFDDYGSDSIGEILKEQNVIVRTGLHCSPSAHKFLNTFPEGTVRFSVGYFNNDNDFSILDNALSYIYENS